MNAAPRPPAPSDRVEWLDFLRGVSAAAIVLFHVRVPLWAGWRAVTTGDSYSALDRALAWLSLPFPFFGSAVMLFFVVSGFAIHYPYAGSDTPLRVGQYTVRRFFRIYPAYGAAVLMTLIAERLAAITTDLSPSSTSKVIASLMMAQNYIAPAGQMAANPSLWSLPVEVELYVTYPLVWWIGRRAGVRWMIGIAAGVSVLASSALLAGHGWPMGNFAKYWIIWVSGAFLAEQVRTRTVLRWRSSYWLMLAAVLAVGVGGRAAGVPIGFEHFIWGGFYFLVVLWGLTRPAPLVWLGPRIKASGLWLGRISYSLYLVHFPVFIVLGAWWIAAFGEKPASLTVPLLASLVPMPVAYLVWRFVEQPAQSCGRSFARSKTATSSDSSVAIGYSPPAPLTCRRSHVTIEHPKRVILVRNYAPDRQPSMRRFADLLHQGLTARGLDVQILEPPAILGGGTTGHAAADKWIRYVDKFLFFPPRLARSVRRNDPAGLVVHVCDHSNALYVPRRRGVAHVVTCHDLLAVRSALGEFPQTQTRWMGRQLQRAVRRGLCRAGHVVCDSSATRADVQRIVHLPLGQVSVIHPAVSPVFASAGRTDRVEHPRRLLGTAARVRYILHVGGNQWYKNRAGVIEIYAGLVRVLPDAPPLVMAGQPLTNELLALIDRHALANRIVALSGLDDEDLAALYSRATVLLFPSVAEGFGWPLLEAMACGCRVIVANRPPMTEVGGAAATYIDPAQPASAAATLAEVLAEPDAARRARVDAGVRRAAGFTPEKMADAYLRVYRELLSNPLVPERQVMTARP